MFFTVLFLRFLPVCLFQPSQLDVRCLRRKGRQHPPGVPARPFRQQVELPLDSEVLGAAHRPKGNAAMKTSQPSAVTPSVFELADKSRHRGDTVNQCSASHLIAVCTVVINTFEETHHLVRTIQPLFVLSLPRAGAKK